MSEPQKPFNKWTFDDLIDWAAWKIARDLIRGTSLRNILYEVVATIRQWKPEKDKPKKRK